MIETDEALMREALLEARQAMAKGEVPVGSVLADPSGRIVARGHNLRETAQDPTAHAELIAMRSAAARRRSFRLSDLTCYVTLEPCPMCAGALVNTRIGRVVYGADDPKSGALRSLMALGDDPRLNHRFPVEAGVLGEDCGALLTEFFERIRASRRASKGR